MNVTLTQNEDLFAWSDGRIALLVEREGELWVIARGWLQGDRMTDVRRWRFDCPRRLVGQLRRLIGERTVDDAIADDAVDLLSAWVATPVRIA